MRRPKVKSLQGKKPDCQLHALVNSGVLKTYKSALKFNRGLKRTFYDFINVKSAIRDGFLLNGFTPAVLLLKYKNVTHNPIKGFRFLNRLPKTGIYIIGVHTDKESHAIVFKNGYVLDSHYPIGLTVEEYGNKRIVKDWCFKIK